MSIDEKTSTTSKEVNEFFNSLNEDNEEKYINQIKIINLFYLNLIFLLKIKFNLKIK